jgi:phosphatidylglycerophosphatase A
MSTLSEGHQPYESRRQPSRRFVFGHPAHFVAFGFGAGLAPYAPGTFGTIVAFPIYYGLRQVLPDQLLLACIVLSFVLGIWVCQITGRNLGVHDHGGMVWDEIAAFMLVLYFVPQQLLWQLSAFVLFRIFDILKPPPIRRLDRNIENGFGVMLDDLLAAFYALLCLAAWQHVYSWLMAK